MLDTPVSQRPALGYEIDSLRKEIAGLREQVFAEQRRASQARLDFSFELCNLVTWSGTLILAVQLFWCIMWATTVK